MLIEGQSVMLIEARTLPVGHVNRGKNFVNRGKNFMLIEARTLPVGHVNRGKNFASRSC